jgi:hypothetical protein
LITETAADDRLFGFCHWAARPGDLVALDSFYIGNLKGVGKVYQRHCCIESARCVLDWSEM